MKCQRKSVIVDEKSVKVDENLKKVCKSWWKFVKVDESL